MKNKGFTLIELLAVIIIIGLIAVITIPKITKQVEDSKKNIAKSSAYQYKKAVNEYTIGQQMNKNIIELNGEYEITENGYLYNNNNTIEVDFSGEKPKNGYLTYINNELQSGCITINKYAVTFENGEVTDTKKGDCEKILQEKISKKVDSYVKAALTANSSITGETVKTVSEMSSITTNPADSGWIHFNKVNDNVVVVDYSLTYGDLTANYLSLTDGNYISTFGEARNKPLLATVGSDVCLTETDCFKVIEINGETATLLANNNINTSTGMQGANGQSYEVAFSGSQYWTSSYDIYDPSKNDESGTNYSVAYYVNQYVENLQDLGFNVTSGRILKKYEVESGGIAESYKESGEYYWFGSASIDRPYVWFYALGGGIGLDPYSNSSIYGVRPVIVISTDDI